MEAPDLKRPKPGARFLTGFFIFAILLVAARWSSILDASYEMGDAAANSILVQQAKAFALSHGHYSRLEFYHPGPALLYVLAAGETVFADWLHLTSPSGGQLVALLLLNAAWIALILVLAAAIFGGLRRGVLVTALFCLMTAYAQPGAFAGFWLTYVFYLPFAAFLLALTGVVEGKGQCLPMLAVTLGALIHQHVSFVGVTAVALLVGVAGNLLLYRQDPERSLLSLRFLRANNRQLLASVAIALVFLAPLVIHTLGQWPGEFAKYLGTANRHAPSSAFDTIQFMRTVIGSPTLFAVVALALLGIAFFDSGGGLRPLPGNCLKSVAIALAGATLGVFLYAMFGVDTFSASYLIWFAAAIPAIAVGALGAAIEARVSQRTSTVWLVAAVVLAVGQTARATHSIANGDLAGYEVPQWYASIVRVAPKAALELDTVGDWGAVWSSAVAVELFSIRRGERTICIARNWVLLFGAGARCTPEELASWRHLRIAANPADDHKPALAEFGPARLYELPDSQGIAP